MLKKIDGSKKFIFWVGKKINSDIDDVVQWFGNDGLMPKNSNGRKVIISQPDTFYIDRGVGNMQGIGNSLYKSWFHLHERNFAK